jgi:hypothetical protein
MCVDFREKKIKTKIRVEQEEVFISIFRISYVLK